MQELVLAVLLDVTILAKTKWVVPVVAGQLTVQVVWDLGAVKQTAGQEEDTAGACNVTASRYLSSVNRINTRIRSTQSGLRSQDQACKQLSRERHSCTLGTSIETSPPILPTADENSSTA